MPELQPLNIQQLVRASDNANALDAFLNADAATMVLRPAADPIESLEYWRDYMNGLSTGKNATIESMTVATGDAGTNASVVTGGTPLSRTFALTIPRGDKGVDGSYTLKAYSTYDLMVADAANIPTDTSINVTNDADSTKNGMYAYDGTAFTKSAYDPLTQSKTYADANALFNPKALVTGDDLNNLTSGYYYIPSTAVADTLLNLPAAMSTPKIAYLFVFSKGGILYQHIVHYTNTTVEEFKRVGDYVGVYRAWQKELELSDINALIQSSASASSGFLISTIASLNFNHATSQLIVDGNKVRVIYSKSSSLLPAQTLDYPSNGVYNLIYTISTNTLSWQLSAIAATDGQVVVGGYVTATKTIVGIDVYSIDGKPFNKYVFSGDLVGNPEYINFGFSTDGLLSLTAFKIRLMYIGNSYAIPARTATLPADNDFYWYQIVYDYIQATLSFVKTSDSVTGSGVVVGYLQSGTRTVHGIAEYYVDGQAVSSGQSDLKTAELVIVNGDTQANYVQPTLPEYQTFLTNNTVHTAIYALYDALMTAHPNYITRTSLGLDDAGNTIYRYDFKPSPVESETQSGDLAKMIVISSVHGFEKAGTYNTYLALKEICERWQNDSKLECLRWNVHFIVVPMAVPTAFDANARKNINDVDIARNFPSDWVLNDPADITYGGASPLSEKEAQYIDAIYAANTDAIYCVSHHNFGIAAGSDAKFLWNASATQFGARLGKALVRRLSVKWKSEYAWMNTSYGDYVGIANIMSPAGSEGKHATNAYGIQAGTFEIGNGWLDDPDGFQHTTNVATLGCEAFINWLLLNLEYGAALKNSSINL